MIARLRSTWTDGMLQFLIDFAVPVTIFVSILISGTEARAADLPNVVTTNRTLVLGSADQLLVLPFVALLTQILAQPSQLVTTSLLLLALCQGGGISKYYSYVARCNVPVSATIPALSTILSFFLPASPSRTSFQLCSARQCGSENFRPKPVVMQSPALTLLGRATIPSVSMDCLLDIDRVTWQLISHHGDESAKVAFRHCLDCTIQGDEVGAQQRKLVVRRIVDLQFADPEGQLH